MSVDNKDLLTFAVVGGAAFLGYKLWQSAKQISDTAQRIDPLIKSATGVVQDVRKVTGGIGSVGDAFSNVSNAVSSAALGLSKLFEGSGSGKAAPPPVALANTSIFGGPLFGGSETVDFFGTEDGQLNGSVNGGAFGSGGFFG